MDKFKINEKIIYLDPILGFTYAYIHSLGLDGCSIRYDDSSYRKIVSYEEVYKTNGLVELLYL